jgi:hypothetical protein
MEPVITETLEGAASEAVSDPLEIIIGMPIIMNIRNRIIA